MAKVKVNGKSYELEAGESVLATLIRNGLNPPPYSCQRGTCLTCLSQLISGNVPDRSQSVLLKSQKEKKLFLACVCYPKEDIEIALQTREILGQEIPGQSQVLG